MLRRIVVLVVVLALASISQAELLVNPGFEDNGGSLDGWSAWSGGSGSGPGGYKWFGDGMWKNVTQDGTAHELDTHIETGIWFEPGSFDFTWWGWGAALLFQDMPVVTGQEYTFTAWARDAWDPDPQATVPAMLQFEQRYWDGSDLANRPPEADANGDGNVDSADRFNVSFDIPKDGEWHKLELVHTIPDGVNYITAVLNNPTWNSSLDWDDASLTPEPTTLALLGFGGLLLRRRRK